LRAQANWLKLAHYSNVDPRLTAHGHIDGMDELRKHFGMYNKLEILSHNLSTASLLCTLTMLFRFLKVLDFQPKLALVSATISKAAVNLYYFFVVFLSLAIGFSACGYLIFGKSSPYFSTFQNALTTCINIFMGDLSADGQMSETSMLLSWKIYYYSFLFITYFVLLNILLAIIVDAYVEVKDVAVNSTSVSEDLLKMLKNSDTSKLCGKKQKKEEDLLQLLDPTRKNNVTKENDSGGGEDDDEVRSMTAVAPEGGQDLEKLKKKKKRKEKNSKIKRKKIIKVFNEVAPSHTVRNFSSFCPILFTLLTEL
jgi:hypothetical protein